MQTCDILVTFAFHVTAIFDLKRGCTSMKVAKIANDHWCVPICYNDNLYDSG